MFGKYENMRKFSRLWESGKIIAAISLVESLLKLAFSISDLVFGHLKDAVPSETRSKKN